MYNVEILYGMVDAHGKAFERQLEKTNLLASGDDLDAAKVEAAAYSLWEQHTASYHAAAKSEIAWKQHTVNKHRVYDLKYTECPIAEPKEGQYVIVRISKV